MTDQTTPKPSPQTSQQPAVTQSSTQPAQPAASPQQPPQKISPEQQIANRQKFLAEEKEKNEELLKRLDYVAQSTKEREKSTDSMKNLLVDVEKDLLYHIMVGLRQRKISNEEAQQLAKDFLASLPFQDKKDLLEKLYQLGEKAAEVKEVYLKYATPYFEEERDKKLHMISQLLKNGRIEEALTVAKGGTV